MAVVIPTTGFLLERFTPRQVFLVSLTAFSLGTLINALATGFPMLLVGRVVQACGTAVMLPLLMTSVMRLVPPHRRGATMGTITIVIAVAPAIGPTIGGAVLSSLSWRWMFWIVLPLAVASLVVGAIWFRLTGEQRRVPLDVGSVLLSASDSAACSTACPPSASRCPGAGRCRRGSRSALASARWRCSPGGRSGCSATTGRCSTCARSPTVTSRSRWW